MKQKFSVYIGTSVIAVWTILKRLTILVVLAAIGWIAYTVFVQQLIHGNRLDQVLSFFALWFLFAYVFIPRIHRVLTRMYIPEYFIGRIRTADGLLSDPVNLAFIGGEEQLHEAMKKAGWILADKLDVYSIVKMILATLFHRDYPTAPVSTGYLFSNRQSFTYQQNIKNKTIARHHVRFWKVPDGWLMPGGYKVDWLAAGTFDRSLGLSYFTFQFTHRIVSDTDIERDHIVKTLSDHSKIKKVTVIDNYFSAYHHRNGGGDSITTDGALPIIKL
jgi:hypothetical protein